MNSSLTYDGDIFPPSRICGSSCDDVISMLKRSPNLVDIISPRDERNFSLLHRVALHGDANMLHYIISYASSYLLSINQQQSPSLLHWLDAQNSDGFSALHFAAHRGNRRMLETLFNHNANLYLENKKGLTPLHIAAQGDQPLSLAYLCLIGVPINTKERKHGTALHWAAYLGNENAVNFLLPRMLSTIDQGDSEGLTSLHLAVVSGNYRVVKKLLLCGANRDVLDLQGNTPLDLALENEFFEVSQILSSKSGGLLEYCSIKQSLHKKKKKSIKQLTILFLLLLFTQGTIGFFIQPHFNIFQLSLWAALNFITIAFLLLAWLTNPGEVSLSSSKIKPTVDLLTSNHLEQLQTILLPLTTQSSNVSTLNSPLIGGWNTTPEQNAEKVLLVELVNLYETTPDVSRVCSQCCIVKPPRSRHCEVCKRCVRVYDHHCPWINNCVGANNHAFFIGFALSIWTLMTASLVFIGLHVMKSPERRISWLNEGQQQIVYYIACGLIASIDVFFLIFHSVLCYVQISNALLNQTTFERFNAFAKKQNSQSSRASGETQRRLAATASVREINPSLILSKVRACVDTKSVGPGTYLVGSQQERNNEEEGGCSTGNAYTMCCLNKRLAKYDYIKEVTEPLRIIKEANRE